LVAVPHRRVIAPQLAPSEIESEPAEADLALDHRIVPPFRRIKVLNQELTF
jgi:hypothetical protein